PRAGTERVRRVFALPRVRGKGRPDGRRAGPARRPRARRVSTRSRPAPGIRTEEAGPELRLGQGLRRCAGAGRAHPGRARILSRTECERSPARGQQAPRSTPGLLCGYLAVAARRPACDWRARARRRLARDAGMAVRWARQTAQNEALSGAIREPEGTRRS